MNQDSGVTELVGFMLILTLILASIAVFTAVYLPISIEETEQKQNRDALSSFMSFNRDITTLCLAEEPGIQRTNILPAVSPYQKARLSLIYGAHISHRGTDYREVIITYEIDNLLTDDFEISLSKRGIRLNNKAFAPQAFRLVTDSDDTTEQMESDAGMFRIEYTYQGTFVKDGIQYHVIAVRLR